MLHVNWALIMIIIFCDHFFSFFRSDDQDLLDDDQSNFDSQEQESQAWTEETYFWLIVFKLLLLLLYFFSSLWWCPIWSFLTPNLFFYVEARDSKQKTQKNLKNDHPERNFWIFCTKNFFWCQLISSHH